MDGITTSESEHRLDLPGGGMIAVRSTHNPDLLRGAGLDIAILDEAAFMEPRVWSEVVRPMLMDRRGRALFLSTPYGRNWFWEVYKIGLDPEETEWQAFHFTSWENPIIPKEEFDEIWRTTSERVWNEEYAAQFVEDAGQVFRGIREAATAQTNAQPLPHSRYIFGVDWGRDNDYTCIAVINSDNMQLVALDRFRQIGWELQRGRLKSLADKWQPQVIWAEANSIGSVNIEALQADGLPVCSFTTTVRSKAPLIEGLALAIERGDIALLPDEVLLNELASYTLERMAGGGYRYSAPPGMHDDTVIATALAYHGARYTGVRIDFA